MRLAPIKSRVPLGSTIRVMMSLGESLEGSLLDIDDDCLIISADDSEIILEASAIAKVERLGPGTNGTGGFVGALPQHVTSSPPVVAAARVVFPEAARRSFAELERLLRGASLDIGVPAWVVYTGDLDLETRTQITRDLVTIKNRYEHALKIKDADRIPLCVGGLRKIAEAYDAPDALQIAGRILWHHGEREKARDLFAEAADALGDSASCFDLAMAQLQTGEREFAPSTLRSCLNQDSSPRTPALVALAAIVLTEGLGKAELAGLVQEAATWRPGAARLAVLHCGLVCAAGSDLAGFPVDQWDSPDADPDAFRILAMALHSRPAPSRQAGAVDPARDDGPARTIPQPRPPAARNAAPAPLPTSAPKPDGDPSDWSDAKQLSGAVHGYVRSGDIDAAERVLTELKRLAPLDSRTWQAEQAVTNAKNLRSRKPAVTAKPPAERPKPVHVSESARGSFARAQEAVNRRNLNQARQLFEQAIAEGDQPVRAVRQLVQMTSYRFKAREEALAILERHKNLFTTPDDLWNWSQDRSTVLEHAGRWGEAAAELRSMLGRASSYDHRIKVIRRTTVALLKSFQPGEAKELLEQELQRYPRDPVLMAILEQVTQAMVTGAFSAVEATLQGQAGATSELSPLLAFHLEHCQYWGVPAERRASREFTEEDLKWVDDLVTGRTRHRVLGANRPRERAEANLTAARIMQDLGMTDDDFRHRLRDFAAAMGDACVVDAKGNPDVIRAYYSEAVSVQGDWSDTVGIKLRQLVMSFVVDGVRLLDVSNLPDLESALGAVMKAKHLSSKLLITLLALPTHGEITSRLIRRIWNDRTTRDIFQNALAAHLKRPTAPANQRSFTEAWLAAAEQDRNRRKIYRQITTLFEAGPALSALDRHSDQLKRISQEVSDLASPTDMARIADCLEVVTGLRDYMSQNGYVERERMFGAVRGGIRDKVREFEEAPTLLSLGVLHAYLGALEKELKDDFERYAANAEPTSLTVEQVVNRYLPSGGRVTVQLQISNGADASPVSNVELEVLPSDDYTAVRDVIGVPESIGAGESRTCEVSLIASRHAVEQQLITLNCQVRFSLRSQRRVTAPPEAHSVRLYPDEEWAEIPNPYAAGLPVENPDMFMGRDQLIDELVDLVGGQDRRSVVVYGQKRAGKSSVLLHLQQKLSQNHLAVSFSVPDTKGTTTFTADLLYNIAAQIYRTLRYRSEDEGLPGRPPEPGLEQIRSAPMMKFNEYMEELQRWMANNVSEVSGGRLVLLLDEFTVIHKDIRTGKLPEDFMKSWKAVLEKGYFRCVLVGNDLMPRFIAEFPNDFQVALPKRVSFLDPLYAERLIVRPILDPSGSSRYRGKSVERILQLTGRSPYYIQLFCRELVQYMNQDDVRAPAIGPADVEAVARKMIAELDQTEFDNLLTPGDKEVTDISGDLVMDVLRATRRESGPGMYHETDLAAHPDAERVIQDLERREVLRRMSGNRYRIIVGLFSEWLQHQWT